MENAKDKIMLFAHLQKTIVGDIQIVADSEFIVGLNFQPIFSDNYIERKTKLIEEAFQQLSEYFENRRKIFDLPLNPQGTAFQKKVWHELTKIPYGETRSYKQIAEFIGHPKACRAVGSANNKNPIAIIIPCHRVIGTNKKLVGYAGGLNRKEFLLKLEKSITIQK